MVIEIIDIPHLIEFEAEDERQFPRPARHKSRRIRLSRDVGESPEGQPHQDSMPDLGHQEFVLTYGRGPD